LFPIVNDTASAAGSSEQTSSSPHGVNEQSSLSVKSEPKDVQATSSQESEPQPR